MYYPYKEGCLIYTLLWRKTEEHIGSFRLVIRDLLHWYVYSRWVPNHDFHDDFHTLATDWNISTHCAITAIVRKWMIRFYATIWVKKLYSLQCVRQDKDRQKFCLNTIYTFHKRRRNTKNVLCGAYIKGITNGFLQLTQAKFDISIFVVLGKTNLPVCLTKSFL